MGACFASMRVAVAELVGSKMSYEGALLRLDALGDVDFDDADEVGSATPLLS